MNVFFRFSNNRVSPRGGTSAMLRLTLFLCAVATCGVARADGLYQVELVVFARDGGGNEERWHNDYNLHYPDRMQQLSGEDGGSAPFQLLPDNAQQLKREATALGQRRNMRVLFHGAWQQEIGSAGQAPGIFIDGGQSFGQHHELEGFITLSADKFLHVDTQLWMTRFVQDQGIAATDIPLLPPAPFATDVATADNHLVPGQLYVLQDQRRLRTGELHYQDHPRFGTLLLVTPVNGTAPQQ